MIYTILGQTITEPCNIATIIDTSSVQCTTVSSDIDKTICEYVMIASYLKSAENITEELDMCQGAPNVSIYKNHLADLATTY